MTLDLAAWLVIGGVALTLLVLTCRESVLRASGK
jgi:hypothetical protein